MDFFEYSISSKQTNRQTNKQTSKQQPYTRLNLTTTLSLLG